MKGGRENRLVVVVDTQRSIHAYKHRRTVKEREANIHTHIHEVQKS